MDCQTMLQVKLNGSFRPFFSSRLRFAPTGISTVTTSTWKPASRTRASKSRIAASSCGV